jgi:hypothetical protein
VRKLVLATAFSSLVPAIAAAQPTVYPTTGDAPRTLDPGAVERPAPAPAPAAKPAPAPQPNVIVVGPDGKVSYDQNKPAAPAAGGYYYPDRDSGFGMGGDPGYDQPSTLHSGPTPDLHVVRKGDTLWDISSFYFSDPWQWPKVWSYNPQITNPHWIYPGDLVRLLPRGMFAEQPTGPKEPEGGGNEVKPPDNLPPPAKSSSVGLKQTAFVEKSELDKSIAVDGSVDEKELLGIGDSVYLSYPANNPPKVGQRYSIYKPDNSVKSGGKSVGAYVRILGALEIVSVKQDKRARGVIVEANQEIERGAKVGPLLKQFKNVSPVAPKVDAQGSIVAMLTKDQLIGQGEVVFVDLGKGSGVEPGNRLFVVRRGDALPPKSKSTIGQDDRRFPARALGEIVIVEVGEKVSIALVTLSVQEMGIGDLVMMQKSE